MSIDEETARMLAEELGEALAQIDKIEGIDIAIKTIRHVRDVLDERSRAPLEIGEAGGK